VHRRQAIRETAAGLLGGVPASVEQERLARVSAAERPLVVVRAIEDNASFADGTMGDPDDQRELALTFEIYTDGVTGMAAVDAINDLDAAIGAALGAGFQAGSPLDGLLLDLRWASILIEMAPEQERYLAQAVITYAATYQLYFGAPT